MTGEYEVIFSSRARRALEHELPEKVAAAVFAFVMGALRDNPYCVGKRLREPLTDMYAARRGEYRVIYRIVEQRLVIEAVSVAHQRDVYHR